jgi:hypothetical protein
MWQHWLQGLTHGIIWLNLKPKVMDYFAGVQMPLADPLVIESTFQENVSGRQLQRAQNGSRQRGQAHCLGNYRARIVWVCNEVRNIITFWWIKAFIYMIIRYVYGKVSNFQSIRYPDKLFVLAHDLELHSLADESANFIGRMQFNASVVFSWYDLFARKGSTVGLTLLSKSKVRVQESKHIFTVVCIIYFFQFGLYAIFTNQKRYPNAQSGFWALGV